MSIESFLELYDTHYYTNIVFCYRLTWSCEKFTYGPDKGRKTNLLLFVNDCKAVFRMHDGEILHASHGDIVYIPQGMHYTSELYDKQSDKSHVIGINFHLLKEDLTYFTAGKDAIVFKTQNPEFYFDIFTKMRKISDTNVPSTSRLNCYFYEIVSSLCEAYRSKSKASKEFKIIEQGIRYLETDRKLDKSVSDIAEMCTVSENYFRRLFKEYSGVSPKEYILNAKIEKAKLILRENNIPVSEIADICGFPDAAYFCRIFKKRTGISPLAYKRSEL